MEGRKTVTTPVYITHANAVTSLGSDLESSFHGLMDKKNGISRVTRFDTQGYASPYAGIIESLDAKTDHPMIFQLADMLIKKLGDMDEDTVLITASTKAGIDQLDGSIPENLLLSNLTSYLAQKTGLKHGGMNINSACASSTIAIAKGAALIQSGVTDAVLICCLDMVSQFVFSGFSALGAMSETPARPFDKNMTGLSLGDGAAVIMLMSESKALNGKNRFLTKISGWGISGDADHLTAPAKDAGGLKRAIKKACETAGITPSDIYAVNTHGTGKVYNDAMELRVLHELFDTNRVVANSIKGAIGHTLGAAGGIEAAFCVKMLEKGIMLPTKGCEDPETGAGHIISRETGPLAGGRLLTMNSGFGGINAALIIERVG